MSKTNPSAYKTIHTVNKLLSKIQKLYLILNILSN